MSFLLEILDMYGFSSIESQNLLSALDIAGCKVDIEGCHSKTQELEALNESLQKCFLRPAGTERQQLNDKFKNEELRAQLVPLLSPFINSINTGDHIATKMLLGATENGVKERLNILVELEQKGHHAETIYLLGGKRDLWIDYETIATELLVENIMQVKNITQPEAENEVKQAITKFFPDKNNIGAKRSEIIKHFSDQGITWPTESDMMVRVIKNYEDLKNSNVILVSAPMKLNDKGQMVRPDTLDTFNQLWKDHSEKFSELAKTEPRSKVSMSIVTTQPYGTYQQQQAIAAFHDKPIHVYVVAEGIKNPASMNIATAFDSFARTIYAGKNVISAKLSEMNAEQAQEL